MKKVLITINKGRANIEENIDNANVEVVDFDDGDKRIPRSEWKNFDAVIYVKDCFAEIKYQNNNTDIEIIDYDVINNG